MSFCITCLERHGGHPAMNEADSRIHKDSHPDHLVVSANEEAGEL